MDCLHCGGHVDPTGKAGTRKRICSDECKRARKRAYVKVWESEHREEIREKRNAIRDKVRKWNRDFYERHRERRKELRRKHYDQCDKAAYHSKCREWVEKNKDRYSVLCRKSSLTRRAREKGAFVEEVDPKVVFDRDLGICQLCNAAIGESDWHIDHVIPLARGGTHEYSNVQLAHAKCNRAKGAKLIPRPANVAGPVGAGTYVPVANT